MTAPPLLGFDKVSLNGKGRGLASQAGVERRCHSESSIIGIKAPNSPCDIDVRLYFDIEILVVNENKLDRKERKHFIKSIPDEKYSSRTS
jgi:hypothetical protein